MAELRKCPVCQKQAVFIGVHDDEGNYRGRIGCDYENDAYSGLCYALHHEGWGDCILCTDGEELVMGGVLFDTIEDAVNEWNGTMLTNSVVVPPCDVGDIVYMPWHYNGVQGIAILTVTQIVITNEHKRIITDFDTDDEVYFNLYKCGVFEFSDIGELVFLTMPEAVECL